MMAIQIEEYQFRGFSALDSNLTRDGTWLNSHFLQKLIRNVNNLDAKHRSVLVNLVFDINNPLNFTFTPFWIKFLDWNLMINRNVNYLELLIWGVLDSGVEVQCFLETPTNRLQPERLMHANILTLTGTGSDKLYKFEVPVVSNFPSATKVALWTRGIANYAAERNGFVASLEMGNIIHSKAGAIPPPPYDFKNWPRYPNRLIILENTDTGEMICSRLVIYKRDDTTCFVKPHWDLFLPDLVAELQSKYQEEGKDPETAVTWRSFVMRNFKVKNLIIREKIDE